jgi:predicted nucleic acid-binding protein
MRLIFIDTNIYLRFFDSNQKDFRNLLDELLKIKEHIFVSNQIVNEINRNKLNVFKKSISNYKTKSKLESINIPEHFEKESNEFDIIDWNKKRKEIEIKIADLNSQLESFFEENLKNICSSEDYVSQKLIELFENSSIETNDEYVKSQRRKEIGNPPGKNNDSLGDQLTWEQLLGRCKSVNEIWIISNDFDYFTLHNKSLYLNAFLISELFQINPNLKLNCYNTLSEGLKSYYSVYPKENQIGTYELDRITEEEKLLNRVIVGSSNIASIGYDGNSATLEIEFLNNSIYQYFDVPIHIYTMLMEADSLGKFFAENIKGVYRYSKV